MVQTLAISKAMTTMAQVQARFSIDYASEPDFFPEWQSDLPQLTGPEQAQLAHIQQRFVEHRNRGSLPEGTVDKLMISPLLDLAGLYDSRFTIRTEASVEIALEAEGEVLQGRMDTLILHETVWVLVIEAKNSTFSLSVALPQLLTYMMSAPKDGQAKFGLVTNGEEFRFVKLQAEQNQTWFDLSAVLSVMPPKRSQLPQVVQILKSLVQ
ncbi:type I restriction enzyme HsdR N-terminal domain-containing protein [filamentous cyanobacterium LEGE 11480]|uniref:Type I restriction enzyme HsdR N-terminal domain-containing protein n=1 Tax=Romeriopsis navalis LEGE 11480 TaxID=2777977 RepID=A0A928VRY5_9CYAN|nr:type I restriction endonuclease [Romeriopsis navalis]MBE9033390.1 type I restriction enzyme HsdR N-terminal domain-containing protein [Romeriopsis navalis LEGE 11480]